MRHPHKRMQDNKNRLVPPAKRLHQRRSIRRVNKLFPVHTKALTGGLSVFSEPEYTRIKLMVGS